MRQRNANKVFCKEGSHGRVASGFVFHGKDEVRTLVATRKASRWFFVFGFEKNERANITASELEALQTLAGSLLNLSVTQLDTAVADGTLQEICHGH